MVKYTESFHEKASHRFPNGEIFVGTASVNISDCKIDWQLPRILLDAIQSSKHDVVNPLGNEYRNTIHRICEDIIHLPYGTLFSDVAVYFESQEKFLTEEPQVVCNRDYEGPLLNGLHANQFYDENQLCTAIVLKCAIVSIAFDNGNGALTVETLKPYRRQGFCKACLQKMSNEYYKKGLHCQYGTTSNNYAAIRAARSSGFIELREKGIWLRISANDAEMYNGLLEHLFHSY